jgi:hypothetical protein
MRQIVKRVKNGQEVKFKCSTCGDIVYSIFVLDGDEFEINWDEIPEKCSCGARLTNRQPIIDTGNTVIDNNSENVRGDTYGNAYNNLHKGMQMAISRGMSINPDIYRRCMIDLANAVSIDYFDMRLGGLKASNCKIPDNIDRLRIECIKRNISYIELYMERSSYDEECDKDGLKEKLNILRQMYDDASKKSEDSKDFEKKRRS